MAYGPGKNRCQNEGSLSKSWRDRIAGGKRTIPKTVAEKYLTIHRGSTSGHIVATTAGNPTRCHTVASTSHFRFAFQIPAGLRLRDRKRVTRRRLRSSISDSFHLISFQILRVQASRVLLLLFSPGWKADLNIWHSKVSWKIFFQKINCPSLDSGSIRFYGIVDEIRLRSFDRLAQVAFDFGFTWLEKLNNCHRW